MLKDLEQRQEIAWEKLYQVLTANPEVIQDNHAGYRAQVLAAIVILNPRREIINGD